MKLHHCVVVFLATLNLFSTSSAQLDQFPMSWPQLVGQTFAEAEAAILADDPTLNVYRVLEGSPVTADYRLDRVRVFVDRDADDGIVVSIPTVG